ncbi:NlpC/P60 family protein [Lutibacter sp. Hel_I_33_5]|uniref:C40 family peptidase n=1 Tax=Lutibacter sp. Hel_I_33_5 TaxID=1566289 RepID=UPI00119F3068|nr:C40 family peptidase [Lutibacter sp. Hel_I_33_5]TVZ55838.1 NlpC/P60 family protein [Lutibacter sp. Hel_I_33_5]
MRKLLFFISVFSLLMTSCSSTKKVVSNTNKSNSKVDKIIRVAKNYKGTKYKFGGVTRKGMDCSGLVFVSFKKENVQLPRVSRMMAKKGHAVSLNRVKKGDLLFFKTSKRHNRINHVGLITSVKNGAIKFIHSTSSRGVIESLLSQKYWKRAFVKARRVL